MTFHAIYRISFYVMLTLATLVLSIDATTDNKLAMLYPPGMALACSLAFLTVDRNPRLAISRHAGGCPWGILTGLVYLEFRYTEHLLLCWPTGWSITSLSKYSWKKSVETDWLLFGLSLMQVLVGTVISQSDTVGMCLFAWAVSALLVLGLFYLHRESLRHASAAQPAAANGLPYPGLIDVPFVLASLQVALLTLAPGGVIFLAMPREKAVARTLRGGPLPKHVTGFGEEVRLGQLGEILENDSVMMTIESSRMASTSLWVRWPTRPVRGQHGGLRRRPLARAPALDPREFTRGRAMPRTRMTSSFSASSLSLRTPQCCLVCGPCSTWRPVRNATGPQ